MKLLKTLKSNSFLLSILMTVYGILLVIWPQINADLLAYIIAAAIIIVGIVFVIQYIKKDVVKDFYKKELVTGLAAISIGVIFFLNVGIVESIIPFVLGIFVLINGIGKVQNAFDLLRIKSNNWKVVMIMAIINVVFGAFLIAQPLWLVGMLFRLIGIALVYCGVSNIVTYVMYQKGVKIYETENGEIFQEQPKGKK